MEAGETAAEQAERMRRGSSFGAAAAHYARFRPRYAEAAVRWSLEPVGDASALRVVDLGAGTGILTGALVALGAEVVAVEPDPQMLAELRRRLPEVSAMAGSAEALPLPDQSVDAVLCGQSMHWFDLDRALPEIGRVVRPGGVLAGLWNMDDDRVEWVAELTRITRDGARISQWRRAPEPDSEEHRLRAGSEWFTPTEVGEFDNPQARTAEALVSVIATTSRFLVMPEAERAERLGAISDFLAGRPETSAGEFSVPTVTGVLRAVRRPES